MSFHRGGIIAYLASVWGQRISAPLGGGLTVLCPHPHTRLMAPQWIPSGNTIRRMPITSNACYHDHIALVGVLKDYAKQKDLLKGSRLHAHILKWGLAQRNIFVGNTLVYLYAKCGALAKAQQVFDELPVQTLVSWTTLILGYSQHQHGEEALLRFKCMQQMGLSPDARTLACTLKACGSIGAAEKGLEIHAESIRQGFLGNNTVLGSALVDMYAKCGALAKAQQVFDELLIRSIVSWNALITGYCQHGHGKEALECFEWMQIEGLSPNAVTFSCILIACGSIGVAEKGEEIHAEIARKGLLENDTVLGNALVDMYAKCGVLAKAQEVFDGLPFRNVVSWTTLIVGYCQHRYGEKALNCFKRMKHEGLSLDAVTLACILKACGSVGAAEMGKEIHDDIVRKGLLGKDIVLGNSLVDMYAKCGALVKAQEVFDKLFVRDVVSWNALIAGHCEHGNGEEALTCFEQLMKQEDILPDKVTLSCILRACISIGAVEKGQMYFEIISARHGIVPTLEHHSCMVDLFGRAGHFEKAMAIIKKMPFSGHLPAWFALLSSCAKWGNVKLGRLVFEHVVKLDEKSAVAYVCMSKTYAAAGMQEDANKIEATRLGVETLKKS